MAQLTICASGKVLRGKEGSKATSLSLAGLSAYLRSMVTGHTTTLRRLERDLGELLAKHESALDLSEFVGYADNPVDFIREVLGGDPWGRQVEIAEAVRDHSLAVVRSANAVGKDWCAARLALWWVYARRGLALITGPTERQVVEVVMGEVARAFRGAEDLPGELYRTTLRLGETERAGILAFTSTEASRLTGFHAPRVLAILTEAQGVEPFAWEGLLACAAGAEDRVLAVGNPLLPEGRFFEVSRSERSPRALLPKRSGPGLLQDDDAREDVALTALPGPPRTKHFCLQSV